MERREVLNRTVLIQAFVLVGILFMFHYVVFPEYDSELITGKQYATPDSSRPASTSGVPGIRDRCIEVDGGDFKEKPSFTMSWTGHEGEHAFGSKTKVTSIKCKPTSPKHVGHNVVPPCQLPPMKCDMKYTLNGRKYTAKNIMIGLDHGAMSFLGRNPEGKARYTHYFCEYYCGISQNPTITATNSLKGFGYMRTAYHTGPGEIKSGMAQYPYNILPSPFNPRKTGSSSGYSFPNGGVHTGTNGQDPVFEYPPSYPNGPSTIPSLTGRPWDDPNVSPFNPRNYPLWGYFRASDHKPIVLWNVNYVPL